MRPRFYTRRPKHPGDGSGLHLTSERRRLRAVKWIFATRFVAWLVIRLCGWCSGVACCINGSVYSSGRCDETVDYMEFLSVYLLFRHEAHASVARSHSRLGQWYVSPQKHMKCGNVFVIILRWPMVCFSTKTPHVYKCLCYNLTLANGLFLHKNTWRVKCLCYNLGMFLHKNTSRVTMSLL